MKIDRDVVLWGALMLAGIATLVGGMMAVAFH